MFDPVTLETWPDDEAPQPRCKYDRSTERYSECDGHHRHHPTCPDALKPLSASEQLALDLSAQIVRGQVPDSPATTELIRHLIDMGGVRR